MTACDPAGFDRGRRREAVTVLRHWVTRRTGPACRILTMAGFPRRIPPRFLHLDRAFRIERRLAPSLRLPPHPAVEVLKHDRRQPRNSDENLIGWPQTQYRRLVPRVTPADQILPPGAQ